MRNVLILTLIALPCSAGSLFAQFGTYPVPNFGPGYRGNISPYLNLIRTNTGINYYLGTRSEQQRRFNAQEFRDELEYLPSRSRVRGEDLPELGRERPIPSGAYSVFNNTGSYFNNTGGAFASPTVPTRQASRPGTLPTPARRAGSPSRTGASPGFQPRPFGPSPGVSPTSPPAPGYLGF